LPAQEEGLSEEKAIPALGAAQYLGHFPQEAGPPEVKAIPGRTGGDLRALVFPLAIALK
jgi:hypothetical protein